MINGDAQAREQILNEPQKYFGGLQRMALTCMDTLVVVISTLTRR
jgi:hypothetical protein